MKNLLIITPYFPPVNGADMQRIRMSLPYFSSQGWTPEVVCVDQRYTDINLDPLLVHSIPANIKIHFVKALNKKWTSKFGLGSIALRSMIFYFKKVNELLKIKNYDLIYFSTTQFPICVLGSYWKWRFSVPFVIDMQDPWHSTYYENKPKAERLPKYWFSYRLNKYLEPIALKKVDGLISVSERYIVDLNIRYPKLSAIPSSVITFGAFAPDLQIAKNHQHEFPNLLNDDFKNIVYIGRGGNDMHLAIACLFKIFKSGLEDSNIFLKHLRFYFIGTSYAPNGQGKQTVMPLARQYGIEEYVVEVTDRISYYHSLCILLKADGLFIPGSDDPGYTASKIYPYLLVNRPLLAIFNKESDAIDILKEFGLDTVFNYLNPDKKAILSFLNGIAIGDSKSQTFQETAVKKYSSENMALRQVSLFNTVVDR